MIIYLDANNLINIFERCDDARFESIKQVFSDNKITLIISCINVFEICAPLSNETTYNNVIKLLNRIESVSPQYISYFYHIQELQESIRAFNTGTNYKNIDPFVNYFSHTFDYISWRNNIQHTELAQTVFDVWMQQRNLFRGFKENTSKLRDVIELDRINLSKIELEINFIKTIEHKLRIYGICLRPEYIEKLARWIYKDPSRCPGERMGFETLVRYRKNIGDKIKDGDIPDFTNVEVIPYVDIVVLERRMSTYALQASKALNIDYSDKIFNSIASLANRHTAFKVII